MPSPFRKKRLTGDPAALGKRRSVEARLSVLELTLSCLQFRRYETF